MNYTSSYICFYFLIIVCIQTPVVSHGRGHYHNKEWADKMEGMGLMPSSTGRPGGKRTGDKISDYIIENGFLAHSITVLKNKVFELKWMDRFVAQPIEQLDPYYQVAGHRQRIISQ